MAIPNVRAIVIRRDFDGGGLPDVQLPNQDYLVKEDRMYHARWQDRYWFSVCFMGNDGVSDVFCGCGDKDVLTGLNHIPSDVELLVTEWGNPSKRTWLMANGVIETAGNPVAVLVPAGYDPMRIGRDNDMP